MSELAADGIPVAVTCRVLQLARQPLLPVAGQPGHRRRTSSEAYRANALFDAHRDDPEFGYRFLVEEARIAGEPMVERTAWRICSAQGWWSAFGKKRGKNVKVGPPVHDDLVERDSPPRHQISCGWLILPSIRPQRASCTCAPIKDAFSNRIVGYCMDSQMKSRLAVTALSNAVSRPAAFCTPIMPRFALSRGFVEMACVRGSCWRVSRLNVSGGG